MRHNKEVDIGKGVIREQGMRLLREHDTIERGAYYMGNFRQLGTSREDINMDNMTLKSMRLIREQYTEETVTY